MARPPSVPYPTKGQQFNSWTAIDGISIFDEKTRRTVFKWRCECGTEIYQRHTDIVRGKSKQCVNCAKGGDLVGQTFGRWTVIKAVDKQNRGRVWECECSCKYKTRNRIETGTLKSGLSQGCKRCNPGIKEGASANRAKYLVVAEQRREKARGVVPDDWFSYPRSMAEAKAQGLTYYFSGKCKRGHLELRHVTYGCPTCARMRRLDWTSNNPERAKAISKRKYRRRSSDPIQRFVQALRKRTGEVFKNIDSEKDSTTFELLGCTRNELKQWIESQFHPNPRTGEEMTWDKFGRISRDSEKWNVDHKIPLASAGEDREKLIELTHYKNLQPMWAFENLSKGSLYEGSRHTFKPFNSP